MPPLPIDSDDEGERVLTEGERRVGLRIALAFRIRQWDKRFEAAHGRPPLYSDRIFDDTYQHLRSRLRDLEAADAIRLASRVSAAGAAHSRAVVVSRDLCRRHLDQNASADDSSDRTHLGRWDECETDAHAMNEHDRSRHRIHPVLAHAPSAHAPSAHGVSEPRNGSLEGEAMAPMGYSASALAYPTSKYESRGAVLMSHGAARITTGAAARDGSARETRRERRRATSGRGGGAPSGSITHPSVAPTTSRLYTASPLASTPDPSRSAGAASASLGSRGGSLGSRGASLGSRVAIGCGSKTFESRAVSWGVCTSRAGGSTSERRMSLAPLPPLGSPETDAIESLRSPRFVQTGYSYYSSRARRQSQQQSPQQSHQQSEEQSEEQSEQQIQLRHHRRNSARPPRAGGALSVAEGAADEHVMRGEQEDVMRGNQEHVMRGDQEDVMRGGEEEPESPSSPSPSPSPSSPSPPSPFSPSLQRGREDAISQMAIPDISEDISEDALFFPPAFFPPSRAATDSPTPSEHGAASAGVWCLAPFDPPRSIEIPVRARRRRVHFPDPSGRDASARKWRQKCARADPEMIRHAQVYRIPNTPFFPTCGDPISPRCQS